MKKQLLTIALVFSSYFTLQAQDSCSAAIAVTPGTTTVGTINGTFLGNCWGTNASRAEWYSFTPSENGSVLLTTDLDTNVAPYSVNTRFSVYTGTCTALQCYTGSDDIAADNLLSEVTFNVQAGITYYIAFDNRGSSLGFQFELTFTALSCFPVESFSYITLPTTTSVTIGWEAPAIGTASSYDIEYGLTDFVLGTGTTLPNNTERQADFAVVAGNSYEFYIRTNCGDNNYSTWSGPVGFQAGAAPVALPYSQGFDTAANRLDGFGAIDGWNLSSTTANAPYAQAGDAFYFSNTNTTETANSWLFVRPVTLSQNEVVTFSFYTRFLGTATSTATLNLTQGLTNTVDSQSLVQSFSVAGGTTGYSQRTASFTAPAAGSYYFGLQNVSAATPIAYSVLVDTVQITSVLGTDNVIASQFSIFPNPANTTVNITNTAGIIVNGVTINDINGRTVKSSKYNSADNVQINVSDLSAGVYMMTITSDKGTTVKKIVKN